jgi:hypothetical protein
VGPFFYHLEGPKNIKIFHADLPKPYIIKVMLNKTTINLVAIALLIILFPLLWLFNQRLNYRRFLTFDTKFSLDSNTLNSREISSTQFILDYFKISGLHAELKVDVKNPEDFGVLGRVISTSEGVAEVYEYSSPEDAEKTVNKLLSDAKKTRIVYRYKNLIVYNKDDIAKINEIMEDLADEEVN